MSDVSSAELDTLSSRLEVASSHATANIPIAQPDETAGTVRDRLIGETFDTVADIAVCVGGRLVGIVEIERLLAAESDTAIDQLMDHDPPVVEPDTDQEIAAWVMLEHGEGSLAVVDNDGMFLGLIPPHRMLAVLMQEHEEDLLRFSGLLATGNMARIASEERITRRLVHRLPWLAIGLLGAMMSASLVGSSEEQLARTVQLAFFLPAIVYMADAVGTQTETLAVRGLSVGVPIRRFVTKEMITGALIGCFVAVLFLPFSLVVVDDVSVAVTVSLALFACCGVASAVALLLPWLLTRLHKDPAFGSGPLATVVQDLLSIAIYLALASAIVS
jgi:magnesium transporter